MAKENEEVKVEKEITATDKTTENPKIEVSKETTVAPAKEKTTEGEETKIPDAESIEDMLIVLNAISKHTGGKGEIAEVPEDLRSAIKYMILQLDNLRDVFKDPKWEAMVDDLQDQAEDGKTPSLKVAIARTFSVEELQELADSEEYEAAQMEVDDNLSTMKQTEEEDAMYDENFQKSMDAADEYATEMGYDESRKNELLQKVLKLYKVMADGILTKAEFAEVDKMLNYDADTADLRAQLEAQPAKEELPDQASVESAIIDAKTPKREKPTNTPGMGSMMPSGYEGVDVTQIGKRKRQK